MVTLAITLIGGAVLNAAAFTGEFFLSNYLSKKDTNEEEKRHNLATEKYEKDYDAFLEKIKI